MAGCTCGAEPPAPEEPPAARAPEAAPAPEEPAPAGIAELAAGAQRLLVADLTGDGQPELLRADEGALRVLRLDGGELGRVEAPGAIQVLRLADLDGDGRPEVLAGWGRSRARQDAPVRMSVLRVAGGALVEEVVATMVTERPDVAGMVPFPGASPPELLVAWFESQYVVRIARARRDAEAWALRDVDAIRMATSFAVGDVDGDGQSDVVVGRVYGDGIGEDGDAFILRPDGSRTPLPVTRGVRALALADLDGDGSPSILVADGWHQHYGQQAQALLTRVDLRGGVPRASLIEESDDQYTLWDVVPVDLDGDGRLEIVTRGSAFVRVLARAGEGYEGTTLRAGCHELVAAEITERPGAELLLSCTDGVHLVEWGADR